MGLDVYLYSKGEQAYSDAHEKAWEDWWETAKDLDDEARKVSREAANLPPSPGLPSAPSEKYPEHLFDRRYLRSSYNGSGFNHAVPDMIGSNGAGDYPHQRGSLYWIFEPVRGDSDEYEFELTEGSIPALETAKARALEIADELRKCDPLGVMSESPLFGAAEHMWRELPTESEVLDWYRSEKDRNANRNTAWGESYSTAKGLVFGLTEGLEVLAVTLGRDSLGRPSAILVYRSQARDSYVQSAEITAEFCDEAISLIRRDGAAFIHWSS
ncbi:hypothetical protein [Amycolatopsis taiwanensis]|uniref:hypothetical protein n=1 Tax=Amycolatopsis taiwanensis TaxID=342230 RepID=UPI0004861FDA|nr:hypothetical protein [Amycolatopsis taiwanensis]